MRKTIKICLSGTEGQERARIVDIISRALVSEFHRNTAVFPDGHISDSALEAIPASINVFLVCADNHHHVQVVDEPAPMVRESPREHRCEAEEPRVREEPRGIVAVVPSA